MYRPAPCAVQLPRREQAPSRLRAALVEADVTVQHGGACRKGPFWFRPLRTAPFRIGCDSALETEGSTLEMAAENAAAGGPRSSTCFPHRRTYLRSASRCTSTTGAPSCLPSTMSETPSAGHMVRVIDWLRKLLLSATICST